MKKLILLIVLLLSFASVAFSYEEVETTDFIKEEIEITNYIKNNIAKNEMFFKRAKSIEKRFLSENDVL